MNKLSTIFLTSVLSIVSTQALAHPLERLIERNTTLYTESTESKESAYEEAMSMLTELKASSSIELKQQLDVYAINLVHKSISLDEGTYITAQEYMNEEGELLYKRVLNIAYQYLQLESNR
ncbi:DUF3316 domain-containing protein [Vibrio sp. VPAP30]|uniref:DUF3316 domain-containing protein n=1 Tax=Vibrio sp. VPAP30 TaxID=1647102 RepID=UPI000658E6FD|nr:DUF3316 domain-containing protein [Vibrio sp. VPAP30]KLN63415.1 hypothetical protein ZX61_17930 [Vibrio sp. VPAP30]